MLVMKLLAIQILFLGAFSTIALASLDGDHSLKQSTDFINSSVQIVDHNDAPPHLPDSEFYNPVTFQRHSILNSPGDSSNSHPSFNNTVQSPNDRFKRDDSKSSHLYTRAAVIARLANGMALQSGLMDGSIKLDDVLPELLNLGKTKVAEVASFKSDPLTKFINEVKTMPEILKPNQEILEFEDKTAAWNEIWKAYESLPDFNKFSIGEKFFTDLEQFVDSDHFQAALLIENGFRDLLYSLIRIERLKGSKPEGIHFYQFHEKYEEICKAFENITEIHKALQEEPNFVRSVYELRHVDTFIRIKKSREENGLYMGELDREKLLKKEFDALKKLTTSSSSAQKAVQLLASVADSRYNSQRTTRKVTSGFSNGLSDVLQLTIDTGYSWIEDLLRDKEDIHSLAKGFRPLIRNMERAGPVDSNLGILSSPDLFRAILDFAQIQKQISTLHPSLADYSGIVEHTYMCARADVNTSEVETIVNSAKKLPNDLKKGIAFLPTLFNLDLTEFKKMIDEFIKSWNFPGNEYPSNQQVQNVVNKLNDDQLMNINQKLRELKDKTGGIGAVQFKEVAPNSAHRKKIADLFENNAQNETTILNCLKKIKEKSEAAANGIYLIRNLRSQDSKAIGNIESAVSALSEASKVLPTLNSIPTDMKKETNSEVADLNNMTDVKTSQIIGESVNSLRAAVGLMELKSKDSELRSWDDTIQEELSNMTSPYKKQTVEKQWGNHPKDRASLEAGIEKTAEFDKKLDVPPVRRRRATEFKSFEDYGKALSGVTNIPDVIIDAEEKEKALDTSIRHSIDPHRKAELEKAKVKMHKLAALDLKFSKHKAALKDAQRAFKKFHESIVFSVKKKVKEDVQEVTEIEEQPTWPIYVGIALGALCLLLVIVGGVLFILHRNRNNPKSSQNNQKPQKPQTPQNPQKPQTPQEPQTQNPHKPGEPQKEAENSEAQPLKSSLHV